MIAADHLGDVADHLIGHFVATRPGVRARPGRTSARAWGSPGRRRRSASSPRPSRTSTPARASAATHAPRPERGHGRARRGQGRGQRGGTHRAPRPRPACSEPEGLAGEGDHRAGRDPGRRPRGRDRGAPAQAADEVPELIPYGPAAKKVLELTFREALRLGHHYIGTEHILLALLEYENGNGVLSGLGIDKTAAETYLARVLEVIAVGGQQKDQQKDQQEDQ